MEIFTKNYTSSRQLKLYTDASGVGMGAVFQNCWFSVPFPDRFKKFHINILELFAVVAAVFAWGSQWRDSAIQFFTDNACIVCVWSKGSSKDPHIMTLLRALFFFCAKHNIHLQFAHLPGKRNILADSLSRLQVERFKRLHTQANADPTLLPPTIWGLL